MCQISPIDGLVRTSDLFGQCLSSGGGELLTGVKSSIFAASLWFADWCWSVDCWIRICSNLTLVFLGGGIFIFVIT
jgi:hypothetical protein